MKKYGFVCLLLLSIAYGQEVALPVNRSTEKGGEELRHRWMSSWIAHPTASQLEYGVFLFRRTFKLTTVPDSFVLYLSADNRYKLYVNGQYISNGPARGDQLNWQYETINIGRFLKPGDNVIAAEVVNFGNARPLAQHTFQTAFLMQVKDTGHKALNTGQPGWKVLQNRAFQPIEVTSAMVNGFYAAGPCDSITGKKYPWGWNTIAYNDSHWPTPKISFADKSKEYVGVGRGYIYGVGLHLVPRSIPLPEQSVERFQKIIATGYPTNSTRLFAEGKPVIIPKNTTAVFLLDQSYLTIGYPRLLVSKGNNSRIRVTYAEALTDKNGQKGNRNETAGKKIHGYYDVFSPDGGNNRLFEPLWLRTFRYVQLEIRTSGEELVLQDYYNLFTAYPFQQRGSFRSDDAKLTEIWKAAWRTARLCAGETYVDCPYYEQLQYVGDTRVQALMSLYGSGDDRLMRNALTLFDQSRVPDGLTLSRYPSYYPQIIPTYSLMWINMVHDYYRYRKDSLFLRPFLQGMENVLAWFKQRVDSSGLLGAMEWWNFTDYTPAFNMGTPDGTDEGGSALISLQYVYALQHAAELFDYYGERSKSEQYQALAEVVKKAVVKHCYNNAKNLFAETPAQKRYSAHTNYFAVLTNTVAPDSQRAFMLRTLADQDLIKPTIYFRFYLFRCLQQTGLGDLYLDNLDAWKNMLDQGLTTFAETDQNPRSDCHAWSASPLFDLLHTVAGIQPASPGFDSVLIEPNFGRLTFIEASFPHPRGLVKLSLERKGTAIIKGYIELPPGLNGRFHFQQQTIPLTGGKRHSF